MASVGATHGPATMLLGARVGCMLEAGTSTTPLLCTADTACVKTRPTLVAACISAGMSKCAGGVKADGCKVATGAAMGCVCAEGSCASASEPAEVASGISGTGSCPAPVLVRAPVSCAGSTPSDSLSTPSAATSCCSVTLRSVASSSSCGSLLAALQCAPRHARPSQAAQTALSHRLT